MSASLTPELDVRTDERASGLRWVASLARTGLPHGGSLPEEVWRCRHRAILFLLWGHVLGLPAFALIRGFSPVRALVEGGALVIFAVLASQPAGGRKFRSAMAALGLLTSSAVLVHLSGGTIEMHFHFFVVVGVLTLYEDWLPFLLAIGYVVVHHGLIGAISPETVFNHPAARAHPWTWAAIHGGFIMAAAAAYVVSWRLTEQARARLAESSRRLDESEERFRGAFERAPIGVALVGLDGSFLRVNGSLCRMLGRSEDELLATTFETITHPDDLEGSREAHRQLVAGDVGALYIEKRYVRADGEMFWAQLSASTVYDDQGQPLYWVSHVEDIDQRKRADDLLRASEEKFRALLEFAPDPVVSIDQYGRIVLMNAKAEETFGYHREELLGQPIEILLPESVREFHVAHRAEYFRSPRIRPMGLGLDLKGRHEDGTEFPVEISLGFAEADGSTLVTSFIRDVTERKRAEALLRQTERKYRTLVEQVPSVVYTAEYGESGRWHYVSPRIESMLGFTPEEWLADPDLWYERMVPEDRERAIADDAHSRTSGAPLRSEYRLRSRDGRVVWVRDEAEAVLDDEGNPVFHHGILIDITLRRHAEDSVGRLAAELEQRVAERTAELGEANQELREAKEVAERANRAKSEFLSRMSHELRTPLNAILGFGQLLETSTLAPDDVESVQQILKGGRHLLDLINEVLDIARIESRSLSLSPEPVSVEDVVHEVVDLILPLAAERGIELRLDSSDPPRFVLADRQRLKQVMLNLLANAVKYNREGGSVTVFYHLDLPDQLSIWVSDTGPGIAPEDRERLFFPFDRLDAETSGMEGTGLGLALTKTLVEAMHGTIGVESELGRGSAFWVSLPLENAPDAGSAHEAPSDPLVAGSLQVRTVLCIEQDPSDLTLMERLLANRPGMKLLTTIQGRMGLDLAREHAPDLIVLDVDLPDIPGEEVVRRLRRDPATRKTQVIVTSADCTEGQMRRLFAAGANEYLTKPLNVQRFLETVGEALGAASKLEV